MMGTGILYWFGDRYSYLDLNLGSFGAVPDLA